MLSMKGNSIGKDLLDYFEPQELMTASAFVQQRDKLLPETFEYLFREFNDVCSDDLTYEGYHLLAVDGSDINIPMDEDEGISRAVTEYYTLQLTFDPEPDYVRGDYIRFIYEDESGRDMFGRAREERQAMGLGV